VSPDVIAAAALFFNGVLVELLVKTQSSSSRSKTTGSAKEFVHGHNLQAGSSLLLKPAMEGTLPFPSNAKQ
jgi:hypothetical protein